MGQEPGTARDTGADEGASTGADAKAADSAAASDAPAEEPESPEEALRRQVAELQEKLKSKKHDLLLALADFENNKKRCAREREARRHGATAHFARRMVEVYVEFESLATTANADSNAPSGPCQALHEGVALTRDLYRSTLEKFGVEPLPAEPGQPFVASRHESVGTVEDGSFAANTVAELVQPGWVLDPKGRAPSVLRKAQVKVARHGPEAPPPPQ